MQAVGKIVLTTSLSSLRKILVLICCIRYVILSFLELINSRVEVVNVLCVPCLLLMVCLLFVLHLVILLDSGR